MIPKSLLLGIILTGFIACQKRQAEIAPEVKKLTEAVYASGNLVPEKEYKVIAATDGYLIKALVNEGQTVNSGELLFLLSNSVKEAGASSAVQLAAKTRALTNPASPLIKKLKSSLITANLKVEQDSIQFVRYKYLFEQNAIAKSTYEKWQQQYLQAQQERTAITEEIKAQQLSLNIQWQQAANQVNLSVTEKNNGHLKSLEAGTIYELYKHTGDYVNPNEPIALIGSQKIIAKLSVDEDDFGKIKLGQKVYLKADAFSGKTFKAHISKIYPLLNKAEQSFRVDAELLETGPASLYGLNIEANIIIAEKIPVLAIPKQALLKGDTVLVKEDNRIRKIKIGKGIEDNHWVQVKTGLTSKNLLVIR